LEFRLRFLNCQATVIGAVRLVSHRKILAYL
jgi:hypothetical protein